MKKKSFFLGVVVGSAIGGVTALLTAPKKGSELREDIKEESKKVYDDASKKYDGLSEKVIEKYNKEIENLKNLYKENTNKYQEEMKKLNKKYFNKNSDEDILEEIKQNSEDAVEQVKEVPNNIEDAADKGKEILEESIEK